MKIKDIIYWTIFVVGLFMGLLGGQSLIGIVGLYIVVISISYGFISSIIRWIKNSKRIDNNYVKANIESFIFEIFILLKFYTTIRMDYKYRAFDLEHLYGRIVEINSLKDFLFSYEGQEKIYLYVTLLIGLGAIMSIIKKFICRGYISPNEVILGDGKIIDLRDASSIKVTNSLWFGSKYLVINVKNRNRTIVLSKETFAQIKGYLHYEI